MRRTSSYTKVCTLSVYKALVGGLGDTHVVGSAQRVNGSDDVLGSIAIKVRDTVSNDVQGTNKSLGVLILCVSP